jgi:hypothetical protein
MTTPYSKADDVLALTEADDKAGVEQTAATTARAAATGSAIPAAQNRLDAADRRKSETSQNLAYRKTFPT